MNRWAADDGLQRADLIRNILTEAADARRERRAMFDRPALPTPADLQHLTAEVRNLLVELNRVLRQNGKRDAELAQSAKEDAIGVSEARTAIIVQLTAEMRRLTDLLLARIADLPAGQVAALTASPVMTGIIAALNRIEGVSWAQGDPYPAGGAYDRAAHAERDHQTVCRNPENYRPVPGLGPGLVATQGPGRAAAVLGGLRGQLSRCGPNAAGFLAGGPLLGPANRYQQQGNLRPASISLLY
ncbi:hypothetical protein NHF48_022360 [Sphingomonas sp. H160509]|uniref:hypothetical protein n=1 Tax=Sphingomonas sp. H160509 TaxID=2955313 RepID=UPI0020968CF5|nr:hypothetical protein [Sphingomonas sp. H160509]MDD1453043.1 hypothetical protein [Sphingomonas sp. H160509]